MLQHRRNVSLFETLLGPERAKFGKICRPETVAKGTVIFEDAHSGYEYIQSHAER